MVSKKQREARKRYRDANPELFPKSEPNNNKKKNVPVFKDPNKRAVRKHPLRIPGMKPGDSCFICKALDHIAKFCPTKSEWERNKICLICRRRGHSLKNCPDKNDESVDESICYNCGETDHSLSNCPRPLQDGGTKFASCFICKERGHLSRNCPRNTHGIYPKGGCCNICSGVTHLARDCPNKRSLGYAASYKAKVLLKEDGPRPKLTKFTSGDDLDDDFEMISGNKDKDVEAAEDASGSDFKDANPKPKKIKGPKVVNFVG